MNRLNRRQFLTASALAAGGALMTSRLAFASANTTSRFVFIILRGALDGLTAVPPYGDADYARLRGDIAIPTPGSANGAIKLDNLFGLHPNLRFLGDSYAARELVVFHAVASPYRERSHFDGQDVLENGFVHPHASQSGWLNRALAAVPSSAASSRKELGVALGQNVPLVMRGPASVVSWSPSNSPRSTKTPSTASLTSTPATRCSPNASPTPSPLMQSPTNLPLTAMPRRRWRHKW